LSRWRGDFSLTLSLMASPLRVQGKAASAHLSSFPELKVRSMHQRDDARLPPEQTRWLRPDFERYMRPDRERYLRSDHARYERPVTAQHVEVPR
jgi:hypothetical protein